MSPNLRERLARLRGSSRDDPPRLADESRWYTEHTALLISTLKWALLGACAGVCVGLGTRVFLWSLGRSADWAPALTSFYGIPEDLRNPPRVACRRSCSCPPRCLSACGSSARLH